MTQVHVAGSSAVLPRDSAPSPLDLLPARHRA